MIPSLPSVHQNGNVDGDDSDGDESEDSEDENYLPGYYISFIFSFLFIYKWTWIEIRWFDIRKSSI